MQDPVQEIKLKLAIEDVVAPYVQLKKAGKYLKACCPFHQEKTPSFFVSPERQIAYCFSCEKGGDHFQFIQDIEGMDFREALELLAEKANVELPKFSGKKSVSKDVKDRLKSVNKAASNFFVQCLDTEVGEKVNSYLKSRGLNEDSIRQFAVGFAPESKDDLYRYLLDKKHEKDDILQSSLAVARDSESKKIMDRFHLRLMFPIDDAQGNIIAFGGRALKKGDQPKYLNSPEYVLYNKSATLYNLSRAKASMREQDFVVVVEGYFDVIASHQAGVPNVVATSGTALTEQQFKLMKRYTKKLALAFDSDEAGQAALLRAVKTAQPLGLELFVVRIPEGKDTADAVKEDPKLWLEAVEKRQGYLDFFLEEFQLRYDLESASGKREFTDAILSLLKGVQHPVEQDHYLKLLSNLVGVPIDRLYDYMSQLKHVSSIRSQVSKDNVPKKSKEERLIRSFLSMLLAFPDLFFELWKELDEPESFIKQIEKLGLVMQMNRLNPEGIQAFKKDFESYLSRANYEIDVSSVYKQIRDHYNLHAEVKEGFYSSLDEANKLRIMAFEAEKMNSDKYLRREEFEKLIVNLYFQFTP